MYPPRTHTKTRPEHRKSIYYSFYINKNQKPKSYFTHTDRVSVFQTLAYHSSLFSPSIFHTLGLFLLHHHSRWSSLSLWWVIHYNIALGLKNTFTSIRKKLSTIGMRMGQRYLNPSGTGMWFDFSSLLGMGRVTGKYMRVGMGTEKVKPVPTPPHCHSWWQLAFPRQRRPWESWRLRALRQWHLEIWVKREGRSG